MGSRKNKNKKNKKLNKYKWKREILVFTCLLLFILTGLFFIYSYAQAQADSITATVKISICGDNIAEGSEDCDNSDLNGKSCKKLGYDSGSLSCQVDCSFNESDCKMSDEENDDKNNNENEGKLQNTSIIQNTEQQPTSMAGKIGIENKSSGIPENSPDAENKGIKVIIKDIEGTNAELEVEISDSLFVIKQGELSVTSRFSVVVDKEAGKIFVLGPAGKTELKILPKTIVEKIKGDGKDYKIERMYIDEDNGELLYIAEVKKEEKFLGLFRIKIPLKLKFSMQDGSLNQIEESFIWKLIDFFSF